MMIEVLPWDSSFFRLRIGKVVVDSYESALELSSCMAYINEYDLLYIFSDPSFNLHLENAQLVDKKVIYCKQVQRRDPVKYDFGEFIDGVPNEKLYDLAIQSGVCSRFKLDDRFPKGSFERLYFRWIEQSVSGDMADTVFYIGEQNDMKGMLTLKIDGGVGKIGLVAVDNGHRGKGYGSALLNVAENYLYDRHVLKMEVHTQYDNVNACHWYENNGFTVESVTSIYHLWL